MRPLLPGVFSAILEDCDVLETRIAFEVRDTKSTSLKRKADLFVGFVGEPANMVRRVHEHFMSAYRSHAVVNPFRRAQGISFDAIHRTKMREDADLPRSLMGNLQNGSRIPLVAGAERAGVHRERG